MKSIVQDAEVLPLPEKHIAVLFEGAWLFTQDPEDRTRILAICPYTDTEDHVCQFGRWDSGAVSPSPNFVGPTAEAKPLLIPEASQHRIELPSASPASHTFTELFSRAAETYPFIYLRNRQKGMPLSLSTNHKVRKISVPMPDEVRPAGQLLNAPVLSARSSVDTFQLGVAEKDVSSYVTFVFFYLGVHEGASVTMHRVGSPGTIHVPATDNLHLIFRVHATTDTPADSYTDHVHLVRTFDTLRKLVQVPDPKSDTHKFIPCDFGIFPASGNQRFASGDTGLSNQELGLSNAAPSPPAPPEQPNWVPPLPTALNLASCAAGVIVCDRDNNG